MLLSCFSIWLTDFSSRLSILDERVMLLNLSGDRGMVFWVLRVEPFLDDHWLFGSSRYCYKIERSLIFRFVTFESCLFLYLELIYGKSPSLD